MATALTMKMPRVSLRTAGEFVWAQCEFLPPPRRITLTPIDDPEMAEYRRMGIDEATLTALDALRRVGDLSRFSLIVAGFLIAHGDLQTNPSAIALPPETKLSELKLNSQSLAATAAALQRALRTEIDLHQVKLTAALSDVVALVRNQLVPVHNSVIEEISRWTALAGSPEQVDAGTLAYMAAEKWTATCRLGLVAGSVAEIERHVAQDPKAEVTGFLLLRQSELPVFPIGVCLFHRTWTNNLFIDYLAGNPTALGKITGIATAMMHGVVSVATAVKATRVWAETTSLSAPIYEKILRREPHSIGDQLEIPAAGFAEFVARNEERWAAIR